MAHQDQLEFVGLVKDAAPSRFRGVKVLEIGSLDINGTIRGMFTGCDYTGIDVAEGPGVDVVCQGQDYQAPAESFDTVISCEVMEHNPHWKETFQNMVRLARLDGLVVMTCALTGRKEHGTTRSEPDASPLTVSKGWDYYRNLRARDFVEAGLTGGLAEVHLFENWRAYDLYLVGSRTRLEPAVSAKLAALAGFYRSRSFGSVKGLRRFAMASLGLRR